MQRRKQILLVFLILTALIFAYSWTDRVVFTDEIIYEEIAFQMYKTGDYLTPRYRGSVWLEKPPLYPWITAVFYHLLPPTPFTRRLPNLLAAVGTIAVTYKLAAELSGKKTAFWSIVLLTTSPLFFFFTKTANLDIPATFFICLSLYFYLKAKTNRRFILLSSITFALGILTRSFLALTPLAVILIDQLMSERGKIPAKYLVLALAISAAVFLPWHLAMLFKHPQLFKQEYLAFILNRYILTQTPGHQPLSITRFLTSALFKHNPATLLALGNFLVSSRKAARTSRLPLIWVFSSLTPLLLATTRHEWYAIQALPPICLLAAQVLVRLKKQASKHLSAERMEMLTIFLFSLLATLPIAVFANIHKETKSVQMLRAFIKQTNPKQPLYNLNHAYTPQGSLFNPRETIIIKPEALTAIDKPFYLYSNNQEQFQLIQSLLIECCRIEVLAQNRGAKLLKIQNK